MSAKLDSIDRSTEEGRKEWFKVFIDEAIENSPIEARLTRKVIRALKDAGTPVVEVFDGYETEKVTTERSIMEQVFNLDECFLKTADGSWVRLTLGNEWDVITDYTTNLEDALKPVFDYYNAHAE